MTTLGTNHKVSGCEDTGIVGDILVVTDRDTSIIASTQRHMIAEISSVTF